MIVVLLFSAVLIISHNLSAVNALADDRFRINPSINMGITFVDELFYNIDEIPREQDLSYKPDTDYDLYETVEFGLPINIPLYIRNLDMSVGYKLKTMIYTNNSQLNDTYHTFNVGLGFHKKLEGRSRWVRELSVELTEDLGTSLRVLRLSEHDPANVIPVNTLSLPAIYKQPFSRLSKLEIYFTPAWMYYLDDDGNDHWDLDAGAKYQRKLRGAFPVTFMAYLGIFMRNFSNSETPVLIEGDFGEPVQLSRCDSKWLNVGNSNSAKGMLGVNVEHKRLTFSMSTGYEYDIFSTSGIDNKADFAFDLNAKYRMSRATEFSINSAQSIINGVAGELILSRMARLTAMHRIGARTEVIFGASYSMFESEAYGDFTKWGVDLDATYQIIKNLKTNLTVSHEESIAGDGGICTYQTFRDWGVNRVYLQFAYAFKAISFGVPRDY